MIIRLTVNNKEYIDIIKDFANQFYRRVYYPPEKPDDIQYIIWRNEYLKPKSKIQKILNYNQLPHLFHEDRNLLQKEIKYEWGRFIYEISDDRIDAKERIFLRDNLNVKVGFSFREKNENKTCLYYSTIHKKYLIQ